ncbi:hypothetical protein CEQ90_19215 [Lewinellaceae bacterium SD302]|nr:hypothetical protein CEQ90_19215 [Lewinellaceae bacterium SD302]
MDEYNFIIRIAISLGLGLLVGLQREYDEQPMAGIRTFGIITLLGSITGLISAHLDSSWTIAGGGLAIAIIFAAANFLNKNNNSIIGVGQTTEVTAISMFFLGAYLVHGNITIGVIIGAVIAILLHAKTILESAIDKMPKKSIHAIMQFVAISLIIFPILPNETYGPYNVINPYNIWTMVVLIVGLSLAGYFLHRWFGKNIGTFGSGILGGLISSTATTVTFSKRTQSSVDSSLLAAFIIVVASSIALIRVLVEVSFITPSNLGTIAPPIIIEFIIMIGLSGYLYYKSKSSKNSTVDLPEPDNPAQLKTAIIFGALYGLITLGVAYAKDIFGESGLYVVSIISGLTDVDAITLSLSNSLNNGEIAETITWKLILLASLANLLFKGGLVIILGTSKLKFYISWIFGISIISGLIIIWLWPETWVL